MSRVATYLWFHSKAEEAAEFYTSVIPNSKVTDTERTPDGAPMVITFELDGHEFVALNGGPNFTFTGAISVHVSCEDQTEVDRLWSIFTKDGEEGPCGWLTDRYGLTWQIIPKELPGLLTHPDPQVADRVQAAMQTMHKIDIAALKAAADLPQDKE